MVKLRSLLVKPLLRYSPAYINKSSFTSAEKVLDTFSALHISEEIFADFLTTVTVNGQENRVNHTFGRENFKV